eukprot:COSAG02_NODE_35139_length_473_cov_0.820856_1_plen_121_part_00
MAREQELRFVGVMETDERHCKPDFALEKSRACTGGTDGGPVHDKHVEANLRLMDEVCFIPFRRQKHEVGSMLKEIIRQAALPGGGLGQVIHEAVPPVSRAPPELEPEPEPEPAGSSSGED